MRSAPGEAARDVAELIDELERLLTSDDRILILADVTADGSPVDWIGRLRSQFSRHRLRRAGAVSDLEGVVSRLDARTWADGFKVLNAWDHQTHEFTSDIVPVLMIDFLERVEAPALRGDEEAGRTTAAILLDYYLLHLLALCATRIWDTPEPTAALGRLTRLVEHLQGPNGSGHHFVADAETLLIYALSQFHPEEQAYDRIIARVRLLESDRQIRFAQVSAAVLSAHLRWGFWLMYERDPVKMRRDNVGDYPWLLNSVRTLARAFVSSLESGETREERAPVTQALLQGLAADPYAFTGSPPAALSEFGDDYEELIAALRTHQEVILEEFEAQKPDKARYAPLALHFNFPHNTLVAIVTLALLEARPQPLTLNELFVPHFDTGVDESQEHLARTLMAFSRGSPDRLGYRGAMLVAYDPLSGLRSFTMTRDTLRRGLGA